MVLPAGALAGLTVLEWGNGRSSAYAGKLLRDFGADVIVLEEARSAREDAFPIGPSPTAGAQRQALDRFLHGGKRSLRLDLDQEAEHRLLHALLATIDVLVLQQPARELEARALAPEAIVARHPQLIAVPISLGGLTPSGRYLRHADVVAQAVSGIAYGTPTRVPDPAQSPPLKPGGYQADYTAGLTAASGALLGVQYRRRTGRGQLVDVSTQAALATFMRMDIAYRTYEHGETLNVSGAGRQSPTGRASTLWGLVPCKDGYFAFQASEQYQWDGLMRTLGNPAWASDPRFQTPFDRFTNWEAIEPDFTAWTLQHSKAEIFHAAQAEHVPVFPCYRIDELLDDAQQLARGFFVPLPLTAAAGAPAFVKLPGALLYLERTPWRHDPEPPRPGEHSAAILDRLRTSETR